MFYTHNDVGEEGISLLYNSGVIVPGLIIKLTEDRLTRGKGMHFISHTWRSYRNKTKEVSKASSFYTFYPNNTFMRN